MTRSSVIKNGHFTLSAACRASLGPSDVMGMRIVPVLYGHFVNSKVVWVDHSVQKQIGAQAASNPLVGFEEHLRGLKTVTCGTENPSLASLPPKKRKRWSFFK